MVKRRQKQLPSRNPIPIPFSQFHLLLSPPLPYTHTHAHMHTANPHDKELFSDQAGKPYLAGQLSEVTKVTWKKEPQDYEIKIGIFLIEAFSEQLCCCSHNSHLCKQQAWEVQKTPATSPPSPGAVKVWGGEGNRKDV